MGLKVATIHGRIRSRKYIDRERNGARQKQAPCPSDKVKHFVRALARKILVFERQILDLNHGQSGLF